MKRISWGILAVCLFSTAVHAADFTWTGTGANLNWDLPANWNPSGPPGAGQSARVSISDKYATANADLAGSPAIEVTAGGMVGHKNGVTLTTPVTLSGGTWHMYPAVSFAWGADRTLNATLTVTAPSFLKGGRGNAMSIAGLAGNALLTFQGIDQYLGDGPDWYFGTANSAFTGGILIDSGNNPNVWANASQALGTGDFTVRSTGTLFFGANQNYSGAARTPVLYLEGGATGMTDHLSGATVPFNVVVQSLGGTLGAGTWASNCVYSGSVTLNGPLTVAGSRGNGGSTNFTITGAISGSYPVTVNTTDYYQTGRGTVTLANAGNSFTSLTLQRGYVKATSEGALSTGPIVLYNPTTPEALTKFYLDKTPDADWTISNSLSGTGIIQVEGGSGFALNTSGTISPGIGTGSVGTITVQGNLGFASGATVAIDLNAIDTQNPVADLVAVTGNVSNLSNATLNISVTGDQGTIAGRQFTILTCANDLSSQAFGGVTVPSGWTQTMAYGNGFVKVTLTLGADTTPPAKITDLRVTGSTTTSITLTWTAPGDDGMTGRARNYDVHYCLNPITDQTWPNNQKATGAPPPADPGTVQSMTVSGLTSGTTYYFAIKTSDEVPNYSDLSNVVSGQTQVNTDNTPPAAVTDLATSNPTATSITLTWTAPGDDGSTGTAASYDIRYSTSTIDASNWANATQVSGEPTPAVAGTIQSMVITGLTADTMYYFALKTSDEVPNVSGLSNIASGRTAQLGGTLQVTPSTLTFSGLTGSANPAPQNAAVQNTGAGTIHWTATVRAPAPAWVSLTNPTGTGNGTFTVNVDWQTLSAGTYTANVDVTDPQAANSPQTVTVVCNLSAGQTNVTWTGAVGTDEASRAWNLAGNWNPAAVPGAGTYALVNASTRYPLANADLAGSPTIEVATGGLVLQKQGVALTTPVILSGGTWTTCTQDFWDQAWGNARTLSGSLTVTAPSTLEGKRGCQLNINGPLAGNGQLTFRSTDQYQGAGASWSVSGANNPFSGQVVIDANNNAVVQIWASRALGTGDITVRSGSILSFGVTQDFTGAARTPVIHMDSGTIAAPLGSQESAPTNVTVPMSIDVTSTGGKIGAGGWSRENIYSGAVTLNGDLTLAGGAYLGTTENSFRVTGAISSHGRVVVSGTDHNMGCCGCLGGGVVVLDNSANSYDGGTVVQDGFLRATSEGALSSGPITVVNQITPDRNNNLTIVNGLRLTKPVPGNWQLSNNLLGDGLIYVENASTSYTLTANGSTISPNTGTGAGTLTVQGNLAFAKNGSQPVTLNIDVIGSGSPLVISNDALAVTHNVSGLSNAALNVTVTGATPADLVGKTLTILTSGNNLTGQSFGSVTVPTGWQASLTYGNGSITMTLAVPKLVGDINNDGYVNVGDLQLLVAMWGQGPGFAGPEDINGDGFVNVGDLQLLVANWGQSR